MTMVCGFSRTFPQLILARIGVGVGEATLTPSALSMITDYFARETRPRAISFYNNGIYIGSGLAYLVGGAVISSLHEFGSVTLPVIGAMENWQTVFMIVGLPGLIVAFAVRFIREPTRAGNDQRASFPDEGSVRYLLTRWRVFGPPCIGLCASTMITYLGGWYAPLFERVWQWPVARIGFWIGVNYLVFGPLGTTIAGWLAERLARRNIVGLPYRLIFAGTAVGGIGATVLPLMPTPELAVVAHAVFVFGGAVASAMGSTTVVTLAPDRLRAQASAIYYLVINLVGLFAGPPLVGLLSDHVFTAPTGIAQAIAVVSLGATLPALLVLWLGVKHYDAELSRIFPTLRGARA
jgi:MFS family permease